MPLLGWNQAGSHAGAIRADRHAGDYRSRGFPPPKVFPVGIELLARPFGEPTLIALAYSYQQATPIAGLHRQRLAETDDVTAISGHDSRASWRRCRSTSHNFRRIQAQQQLAHNPAFVTA